MSIWRNVTLVIGFRPDALTQRPRDVHRSLLEMVSKELHGSIVFDIDDHSMAARQRACFDRIKKGYPVPIVYTRPRAEHVNNNNYMGKRLWKFFADSYVTRPIVAFADDDSCFIRPLKPADIVHRNQVRVRGINTFAARRKNDALTTFLWNRSAVGGFMTDFPAALWTAMLPDLRAFVTRRVFGTNVSTSPYQFIRACTTLQAKCGNWDEFSLLYHFAAFDPNWSSRYDLQLAPFASLHDEHLQRQAVIGLSSHQHQYSRTHPVFASTLHMGSGGGGSYIGSRLRDRCPRRCSLIEDFEGATPLLFMYPFNVSE